MTKNAMTKTRRTRRRAAADPKQAMARRDVDWLMSVRTRCLDPKKEDEFNYWYNSIDIPDVLEVPGYLRARRGLLQPNCGCSARNDDEYVALYDIRSDAIDKTIIDMLMATRRMEQRGRSTDVLEVTERTYYRRYASSYSASSALPDRESQYLLFERFDSRLKGSRASFADGHTALHRRLVDNKIRVVRATRYELYRVLMIEPKVVPRFLTVYEIFARSPEQICLLLNEVSDACGSSALRPSTYVTGDSALFLMIREQVRK